MGANEKKLKFIGWDIRLNEMSGFMVGGMKRLENHRKIVYVIYTTSDTTLFFVEAAKQLTNHT